MRLVLALAISLTNVGTVAALVTVVLVYNLYRRAHALE